MIHWTPPACSAPTGCARADDPTETTSGTGSDVTCPRCRTAYAAWANARRRATDATATDRPAAPRAG